MDPRVQASWISGGLGLLGGLFGRKSAKIPAPKTAEQMKADMDTMYTGTTPWERLGASGGGVPQASAQQDAAKIQARVQQQAHRNQMKIETMKTLGMLKVAGINKEALLEKTEMEQNTGGMAQARIQELMSKANLTNEEAQTIASLRPAQIEQLNVLNEKYGAEIEQINQLTKTAKTQAQKNKAEARLAELRGDIVLSGEIRGWVSTLIQGGALLKLPQILQMLNKGRVDVPGQGVPNPFNIPKDLYNLK